MPLADAATEPALFPDYSNNGNGAVAVRIIRAVLNLNATL
jgi:hypothetical protein